MRECENLTAARTISPTEGGVGAAAAGAANAAGDGAGGGGVAAPAGDSQCFLGWLVRVRAQTQPPGYIRCGTGPCKL